jgi:hypothetical protein
MKANGHDLTNAFWRNEDGSWICIDPVTIDHPQGRIQLAPGTLLEPGKIFMGVDIAAWLDEQHGLRRAGARGA